MRLKRRLKKVAVLLAGNPPPRPEVDEPERIYRHIFRYLTVGSDKRHLPRRGQPDALVLQMAKVASTSIQAALRDRGVNAFHSHGLSSAAQHVQLSQLLECDLTIPLVGGDLRRHVLNVGLQMLTRWYQAHSQRSGRKLKVVTLTRDPVTHYPSGFAQRGRSLRPMVAAWQRDRLGLGADRAIDEPEAIADFVSELASIIVEARCSDGAAAYARCIARARQRWPEHPIVRNEIAIWLGALNWFDREMTPIFGLDMLSAAGFCDRGWAEQSNDWAEVIIVRFEELAGLLPEIQRFFALAEFALPRRNVTSGKRGGAEIQRAIQAALSSPVGHACARELRMTPYGRACGYDKLVRQ